MPGASAATAASASIGGFPSATTGTNSFAAYGQPSAPTSNFTGATSSNAYGAAGASTAASSQQFFSYGNVPITNGKERHAANSNVPASTGVSLSYGQPNKAPT